MYVAALDQALDLGKELLKNGAWLFISRRGTRELLERELHIRVIDIPISASDYIPAIQQARKRDGKIAFFSGEEVSEVLRTICYLQDIKAHFYRFSDDLSCKRCVQSAME